MMQTARVLALIGALPLTVFGINVGKSFDIETGWRMDRLLIEGEIGGYDIPIEESIPTLEGISLEADGRLTLNDVYLRANGSYTWILSRPSFVAESGSHIIVETELPRHHIYDVGGALGCTFYFSEKKFALAPELGYVYTEATIAREEDVFGRSRESVGSVFVGLDFHWILSTSWKFGLLFNCHLFGFRFSDTLAVSFDGGSRKNDGRYMGPEAKATFDYSFTENWSMGFAYRFKYLFTGRVDFPTFKNETERWMTNQTMLRINYLF